MIKEVYTETIAIKTTRDYLYRRFICFFALVRRLQLDTIVGEPRCRCLLLAFVGLTDGRGRPCGTPDGEYEDHTSVGEQVDEPVGDVDTDCLQLDLQHI